MKTKPIDLAILAADYYVKNPYRDDVALKEEIEKRGFRAEIVSWADETFSFDKVKVSILRACWDYQDHLDFFLKRLKHISAQSILVNPYAMVKENANKKYLKGLSKQGVPIVPSFFITQESEIEERISQISTDRVIIKPVVSASGHDTHLFYKKDIDGMKACVRQILGQKEVLIQPFMERIQTCGEKSIVVIDGQITFAMQKKPKEGGFLVHRHYGGQYLPHEVSAKEKDFVSDLLQKIAENPAYMRIDLLESKAGHLLLLELELIEPNLYLCEDSVGKERLADYLCRLF